MEPTVTFCCLYYNGRNVRFANSINQKNDQSDQFLLTQ